MAIASGSCAPPEPPPAPTPSAVTQGPFVRVAIATGTAHANASAPAGLAVIDPDEGIVSVIAGGIVAQLTADGSNVVVATGERTIARSALVLQSVDSASTVTVGGHAYRGSVELRSSDSGIVMVNHLPLESYLVGVVGAEMGNRSAGDEAALAAQAIVSRTWAVKNENRNGAQAYDLVATVADQLYIGASGETAMAQAAVDSTRGEILTWNNQPIDAFFFATCGGETEDGTAAFAGADRPYLRAVDDRDPNGVPWCAIAPHYTWTTGWSADQLSATLHRTLAAEHLPGGDGPLRSIEVTGYTRSGRVASVALRWAGTTTTVSGQAIRRVLSPPEGGWLKSTAFTLRVGREGSTIDRIDVDGRGNGHGVGMCQWGAIGRARGGQDYRTILASYFPGTEIQRLY